MKKFALFITYVYAFCCPLEFILNVWFGSSVKYIAAAAVVVMAFYFIIEQNLKLRFTAFQFCLLGWAVFEAVSVLWTGITYKTYPTLLSYLMMAAFVLLLSFFPFDKKEAEWLIMFYSLGTVIMSIVLLTMGKVDGSAYIGRLTVSVLGKNQDPNSLAAILLSGTFYSLYKSFEERFRILYFSAFLLQSVALFFTGSRGGLVAYFVALIVFIFVKIPRKKRVVAIIITAALVVAGCFVLEAMLPDRLFKRLFNFSAYLESNGIGRIKLWATALEKFVTSPIIGFGTTSHFYHYVQVFEGEYAMHNTYLCVAFETGILGLALFLTPFISTFSSAFKRKDALIVTIMVANIVAAFFLDALHVRFLWNALVFSVVYKNSFASECKIKPKKEKKV